MRACLAHIQRKVKTGKLCYVMHSQTNTQTLLYCCKSKRAEFQLYHSKYRSETENETFTPMISWSLLKGSSAIAALLVVAKFLPSVAEVNCVLIETTMPLPRKRTP